ncbi:MAG: 16S rRNA (uracil(1498)-N(3))-methyltransferase [Epsilonproteobacteria bacterium]|nr:16S rRNA (uracil(1498)-N(3))-methyltransferase [Campylobacterota bacterium]
MIYFLCNDAGRERIEIKGEDFKYLIKVRRHSVGDIVIFRSSEKMDVAHRYTLERIESRKAVFMLENSRLSVVQPKKKLHIGWCMIDNKSVEKVLPALNEMGVAKITFIYCQRSQKNFKPDFKRFGRILEASNQQCGRTDFMDIVTCNTLEAFITQNPDTKVFDFCEKTLKNYDEITTVLIGCEGGFSPKEKELLSSLDVFRLNTPMVLRSESAALAVAAKVLL